jgi:hypothetical protein
MTVGMLPRSLVQWMLAPAFCTPSAADPKRAQERNANAVLQ